MFHRCLRFDRAKCNHERLQMDRVVDSLRHNRANKTRYDGKCSETSRGRAIGRDNETRGQLIGRQNIRRMLGVLYQSTLSHEMFSISVLDDGLKYSL